MSIPLLIYPVFALLGMTLVIAIVMMWTRVVAMMAEKVAPQRAEDASDLKTLLPRKVMRISDNYNHLHEQPIVFYVLCIVITLANRQDELYAHFAWMYVLIRLLHSIVQICIGDVMKRFILFLLSWLILGAMMARFAVSLWGA